MIEIKKHTKYDCKKLYECAGCSFKTSSQQNLQQHVVNIHSTANLKYFYNCSKCFLKYKYKWTRDKHEKSCGILVSLKCDFCKFETYRKGILSNHIFRNHLKSIDPTEKMCSKCSKIFKSKRRKRLHEKYCGSKPSFKCNYCTWAFRYKGSLRIHVKTVHIKPKLFKCDDCSYTTLNVKQLKKHQFFTHSLIDPNNYHKCSKCPKKYKRKADRNNHEKICGVEPNLRCNDCDYKTNIKRNLQLHIEKHHTEHEQKFHKCKICKKNFGSKLAVQNHLKKFHYAKIKNKMLKKCEHCTYSSFSKIKLLNHINRKHHPDYLHE